MAFGTFYLEEKERIQKETSSAVVKTWKKGQAVSCTLSILLIGRTGEGIRDYVCSMAMNMDQVAGGAGLAFYTQDAKTIAEKIATRRELEAKLMEPDGNVAYEAASESRTYIYEISRAGRQSISLKLHIDCVTGMGMKDQLIPEKNYDAIWLLTDFPAAEPEKAGEYGPADHWLRQKDQAESPVFCCVIMDCLEHLEKKGILQKRSKMQYSEGIRRKAMEGCNIAYPALKGSSAFSAKLFLTQVYGGFAFSHWTEDGKMVLEPGRGTAGAYTPSGCHGPLFETIDWARNNIKKDFFLQPEGNALWESLQTAFVRERGGEPWGIMLKHTEKKTVQEGEST